MARDESLEETSGHSEVPIQEVVDSVDNDTELNKDSIRTLGEAVVNFSGAVRPKTDTKN